VGSNVVTQAGANIVTIGVHSRSKCTTNRLSFTRYSDLLVETREIFIPHLYLAPQQRLTPWDFAKMFDIHKTRMIGLPYGEESMTMS